MITELVVLVGGQVVLVVQAGLNESWMRSGVLGVRLH